MWTEIEHSIASELGNSFRILKTLPLTGGDINSVFKLETTLGEYCIKVNNRTHYPKMFQREAEGLQLLAANSSFLIPEVVCYGEAIEKSYLLISYLENGVKSIDFWEKFGVQLANMHKATSSTFGLSDDNYIGTLRQINTPNDDWHSFFANNRLLFQASLAFDNDRVNKSLIQSIEKLVNKLDDLIPKEPSSLLHGDLWSGNYMISKGGDPIIIDPAVYYGHREMDIAMTKLFGGFSREMYDFYHMTYPLESGWEDRVDLHNLYPLLVHVNLFGGSYVQQVKSIVSKYM